MARERYTTACEHALQPCAGPPRSISLTKRTAKITIGQGAVVNGTLLFKREVELRVSNQAPVGKIVGATPIGQ